MSDVTSNVPATGTEYKVWSNGRIVSGSAREVLHDIQLHARQDSEIRKKSLDRYASDLISDAPYFFPDGLVPQYLQTSQFASEYEQALEYLAAMPSSGVRVIQKT